jgi:hypothetical protein
MQFYSNTRHLISIPVIIVVFFFSCSPKIAPYDNYSYTQAVALKTEVMTLVDQSTQLYSDHEKEVNEVIAKMEKQFDYELHKDRNDITTDLWFRMKDPKGKLFGAFITRWKKDDTLRPGLVRAWRKDLEPYFDKMIAFENSKSKK